MNIKLVNIKKSFKNNQLYENFFIEFEEQKINCILGESGCGKSTLLNILTGIEEVEEGIIKGIDSRIAYVFQEDRLIEWKSIRDNLDLPLRKIYCKSERVKKIEEILEKIGLIESIDNFPRELSGGMRQRVNIIRALLYEDKIIVMDEPFKSLDEKSKEEIKKIFKEIQLKKKGTSIMVTHDIEEAINLADNIFLLGNKPVEILESFYGVCKLDKENIKERILNALKNTK